MGDVLNLGKQLRGERDARVQADQLVREASNCVARLRRDLAEAEAGEAIAKKRAAEVWAREETVYIAWRAADLEDHERTKAQRQGFT